jgi:hypothetical protein
MGSINQTPGGPMQQRRDQGFKYSPTSTVNRVQNERVSRPNPQPQSPPPEMEMSEESNPQKLSEFVKVQGGSLKTWAFSRSERIRVSLESDGRPMDADIELWNGPNNAPQKIKMYSEDGAKRRFDCVLESAGGSNSVAVRNLAWMEFPLYASVTGVVEAPSIHPGTPSHVVQGGSLRTYPFPPDVKKVQVLLMTNGRPLNARLELLQGPNTNRQIMEVYSEDGMERPFCTVISTPGSGHVLRVVNASPMEFPFYVYVEPYEFGIDDEPVEDEGILLGPISKRMQKRRG